MSATVKDADAAEIARRLGVAESICAAFLSEAQRREPRAEFCIRDGQEPRALINFPYGDVLELERREGFVTIGCGGGFPGVQYCLLIPLSGVVDSAAALRFQAKFRATEVLEDTDLLRVLTERMAPVYERIEKIRNDRPSSDTASGVRATVVGWCKRFFTTA